MHKVVCISTSSIEGQIKIGGTYYIDMSAAWGDSDGDWFADVYAGEYGGGYTLIGMLPLSYFQSYI